MDKEHVKSVRETFMHSGAPVTPVDELAAYEAHRIDQSCRLLGLGGALKRVPQSKLEVHTAIVDGALSWASLFSLVSRFDLLEKGDLLNVLGLSPGTLRRRRKCPRKPLPAALASKVWGLTELLVKATEIFGGREEALQWMRLSAAGLNGHRPVELLQTIQGTALVDEFLTRLEYNVYS